MSQTYIILGFDGQEWKLLEWTIELDEQKQITKQRTKKLKYDLVEFRKLMTLITECTICDLKQAPLNLNKKGNGDGTDDMTFVSDGLFEQIELLSSKSHRISNSYAADELQEEYPTLDRQKFMAFRNQLLNLISGKS